MLGGSWEEMPATDPPIDVRVVTPMENQFTRSSLFHKSAVDKMNVSLSKSIQAEKNLQRKS